MGVHQNRARRHGSRALTLTLAAVAAVAVTAGCGGGGGDATVGPRVGKPGERTDASHWHAALGVYDCGTWLGDDLGAGLWVWPGSEQSDRPLRAGTETYAGLHSHGDGIIHMEPSKPDDAGNNATLGRYFTYGGWTVGADRFSFLGTARATGDSCGEGTGVVKWWVNGSEQPGDPAAYKLDDDAVVVVGLVPAGDTAYPGDPPSAKNLPNAENQEGQTPPASA